MSSLALPHAAPIDPDAVVRALAQLFRSSGYRVSGIVKDPMTWWASFIFYVDDGGKGDVLPHPTAVRISDKLEIKFDGPLAEALETLVRRLSF